MEPLIANQEKWDLEFVVVGNPCSTNEAYATITRKVKRFQKLTRRGYFQNMTHRVKTVKANNYQKAIAMAARVFHRDSPRLDPCLLDLTWYYPRRGRDIDNPIKLTQDAMTKVVYADDTQIVDAAQHKRYDNKNPRVEVRLKWLQHDEKYGL